QHWHREMAWSLGMFDYCAPQLPALSNRWMFTELLDDFAGQITALQESEREVLSEFRIGSGLWCGVAGHELSTRRLPRQLQRAAHRIDDGCVDRRIRILGAQLIVENLPHQVGVTKYSPRHGHRHSRPSGE